MNIENSCNNQHNGKFSLKNRSLVKETAYIILMSEKAISAACFIFL